MHESISTNIKNESILKLILWLNGKIWAGTAIDSDKAQANIIGEQLMR
jgi:hypothetical protein